MASLPLLSPLVTRILELSGFPPELKTRDIQAVFQQWEDDRGGFKIKWVNDTTALVIFADAAAAKRAYLYTLMSPPPSLMNSSGQVAKVRPYDGDDASSIISSVQNRPRGRSNAGGSGAEPAYGGAQASPAQGSPRGGSQRSLYGPGHRRNPSGSNPSSLPAKPLAAALFDAANGGPSPAHHLANAVAAEEEAHGPEVIANLQAAGAVLPPNILAHASPGSNASPRSAPRSLPANPILAAVRDRSSAASSSGTATPTGLEPSPEIAAPQTAGAPRIGDAGKRLVAGALGVRHPALPRGTGSGSSSPASRSAKSSPAPTSEGIEESMAALKMQG